MNNSYYELQMNSQTSKESQNESENEKFGKFIDEQFGIHVLLIISIIISGLISEALLGLCIVLFVMHCWFLIIMNVIIHVRSWIKESKEEEKKKITK